MATELTAPGESPVEPRDELTPWGTLTAASDAAVQKANEAIAIRPKRGRLTLLSRRIYNALLFHAQQQGPDAGTYTLPLATLVGTAHFNSRNVGLLKDHIREMQTTLIEWNSAGPVEKRWTSSQLLGTVEIVERGSGYPVILTWTYPERVKEQLLRPSRYTRIMLEVGARMRSYAAATLFELGLQYLTSPSHLTMREDLIWWASVLTGRSDVTKVDYRYFKRDVLRPALAEVDALQDELSLELIEHKEGRRITELQFRVHKKVQAGLGVTDERNPFDLELVDRIRKLGIRPDDADRIYSTTDEGLLRATVEHVEARLRNASLPAVGSSAAYFKDALKRGYAPAVRGSAGSAGAPAPAEPPKVTRPEAGTAPKALPRPVLSIEALRTEWLRDQGRAAEVRYAGLSSPQQEELVRLFEAEELPTLMRPIIAGWGKAGLNSPVARPTFFRWLARRDHGQEPDHGELLQFAAAKGLLRAG